MAAHAQIVSFGFQAGVPATAALPGYSMLNPYLDTGRWTAGPSVEFHLFRSLSFEVDGLFRGYEIAGVYSFSPLVGVPAPSSALLTETFRQDTKAWDFPLMLKYRFAHEHWRPFADGGYQLTYESSDLSEVTSCFPQPTSCGNLGPGRSHQSFNRRGPVAGGGIEFPYRRFKIAPEIRYTHLTGRINQITVIGGFTF